MVQFWPGSQITYLTEQTQRVLLDGEQGQVQSHSVTLKCGVSQGSVLGPILFTLYMCPLGISAANMALNITVMPMTSRNISVLHQP